MAGSQAQHSAAVCPVICTFITVNFAEVEGTLGLYRSGPLTENWKIAGLGNVLPSQPGRLQKEVLQNCHKVL